MRTQICSILLLLVSCRDPEAAGNRASASAREDSDRIDCALSGATAFRRVCDVERSPGPRGLRLTVRAPDGGFRRFLVTRDGRGLVTADGAEPAVVSVIGPDRIEVTVGSDRYRLPATVR